MNLTQVLKNFSFSLCDRRCTLKGWCLWNLSIRWSVSEIYDLRSTVRAGYSCFEQKPLVCIYHCFFLTTLQIVTDTSLFLYSGCE